MMRLVRPSFTQGHTTHECFLHCDLDFDPTTFIHELKPYLLKKYLQSKNKLYRSRLSKVIALQTDRQTDRQTRPQTLTHHFTDGNNNNN